jgi:uncharacterized damage-inducible protein DinB
MRNGLLIEKYLLGPEILRRAVSGISDEQLSAAPIPGKWSTRQVVMHLVDFDLLYADHMKRVIAEDRPTLVDGDAESFALRLAYDKRDVDHEIWMIKTLRRHMAAILRNLDADDFVRVGMHQDDGPLTLAELLERVTDHIPHHVRAIEEKRRALDVGRIEMPLHMAAVGVR